MDIIRRRISAIIDNPTNIVTTIESHTKGSDDRTRKKTKQTLAFIQTSNMRRFAFPQSSAGMARGRGSKVFGPRG